jgi:hypothetical protein
MLVFGLSCAPYSPAEPTPANVVIVDVGSQGYKLEINDSYLGDKLKVQGAFAELKDGPRVMLTLKNVSSARLPIEYRVKCFDEKGAYVTDPGETWIFLMINAGETTGINFRAKDKGVRRFHVLIRRHSPIR